MKKEILVAAALSGLMAVAAHAQSAAAPAAARPVKGECAGVNACKGKGDCGGKGHECAGKNACKGQGWVKKTEKECKDLKGTWKKA